jgi:outer membrane protein assembly factor BamB
MASIFFSYVEEDGAQVPALASLLEAAGHSTWYYERDSIAGRPYPSQLAAAIDRSDAMVVIISPDSMTSVQVDREVTRAFESSKQLIPLLRRTTYDSFRARRSDMAFMTGAFVHTPIDGFSTDQISAVIFSALANAPIPGGSRVATNQSWRSRARVLAAGFVSLALLIMLVVGLYVSDRIPWRDADDDGSDPGSFSPISLASPTSTSLASAVAIVTPSPATPIPVTASPMATPGLGVSLASVIAPASDMRQGNPGRTGEQPGPGPGPDPGIIWSFDAQEEIVSSPVVRDSSVFFGTAAGTIYALNARTGDVRWSYAAKAAVRSSPALSGDNVILGDRNGALYALNTETGALEWSIEIPEKTVPPDTLGLSTPLALADRIFVCDSDGDLVSVAATSGEILWRTSTGTSTCLVPSTDGSRVFTVAEYREIGRLYAIDAVSGNVEWTVDLSGAPSAFPITNGETVIVATADGTTSAYDSERGDELWWFRTLNEVAAPPVISGERVFISDSFIGEFYALDLQTGEVLWKRAIQDPTNEYAGNFPGWNSSASVVGNTVIWGNGQYFDLWAFDTQTGVEKWQAYTNGGGVYSSPAIVGGVMYVGCVDGMFYAYGG